MTKASEILTNHPQDKTFCLTGALCFLLFSVNAKADNIPQLKLHIFAEDTQEQTIVSNQQAMKMVVFTPEEHQTLAKPQTVALHTTPTTKQLPVKVNTEQKPKTLNMVVFNDTQPIAPRNTTANPQPDKKPSEAEQYKFNYFLNSGYQHDEVDWTIAAPSGRPNILSELQWKDIESVMFKTGFTSSYDNAWYGEGNISYGTVVSGKTQDSDYVFNDRRGEFSRSYSTTNDGYTIALSTAFGYQLNIGNPQQPPSLSLTPKAGYAYHDQKFRMTDGVQVISEYGFRVPLGQFNRQLDSSYEATFHGALVGLNSDLQLTKNLDLQSTFEYHFANYKGKGNWNLRSDFQHPTSFSHKSDGDGMVAHANLRYQFNPNWKLHLGADYQKWKAYKGTDTTYFSDGYVSYTPLNNVNWDSYGFNLGVEYQF